MSQTTDRKRIEELLGRLSRAHYKRDAEAIVSAYYPDALICDLAPPLSRRGMNVESVTAWLATWDGPIEMEEKNVEVNVSEQLAVVTALNRMRGQQGGEWQDLWFRTTLCLEKRETGWLIVHDHTSVPFHMDGSYRAAVDLAP